MVACITEHEGLHYAACLVHGVHNYVTHACGARVANYSIVAPQGMFAWLYVCVAVCFMWESCNVACGNVCFNYRKF